MTNKDKERRAMTMTGDVFIPDRHLTQDERLRRDNPGLKELYDKYQTMLQLLKPSPSDEDIKQEQSDKMAKMMRDRTRGKMIRR